MTRGVVSDVVARTHGGHLSYFLSISFLFFFFVRLFVGSFKEINVFEVLSMCECFTFQIGNIVN